MKLLFSIQCTQHSKFHTDNKARPLFWKWFELKLDKENLQHMHWFNNVPLSQTFRLTLTDGFYLCNKLNDLLMHSLTEKN